MMRLCYLILAHNNLEYVAELIESLSDDNIGFIVHVDAKCQESMTSLERLIKEKDISLIRPREDIRWGDKSMIDVVNRMSLAALNDNRKYDYFILLSGQDMPVKSPEYIRHYIETGGLKNYMAASPMLTDDCLWLEQGRRRLQCYAVRLGSRDIATIEPLCMNWGNLRQIAKTFISGNVKAVYDLFRVFFSKKRKGFNMPPYGGEFWWRMNRESLDKILHYYYDDLELIQEVSFTSNPDEIVYNTLAYNLCDNIERSTLTYINWQGKKSPEYIVMEDKHLIKSLISKENILFCRKVKDKELLKYVRQFF